MADLADIPVFLDRRPGRRPVPISARAAIAILLQVEQPRRREREDAEIYQAVLLLREKGHKVWRAGRFCHSVDGDRLSDDALLNLAAEIARPREVAE